MTHHEQVAMRDMSICTWPQAYGDVVTPHINRDHKLWITLTPNVQHRHSLSTRVLQREKCHMSNLFVFLKYDTSLHLSWTMPTSRIPTWHKYPVIWFIGTYGTISFMHNHNYYCRSKHDAQAVWTLFHSHYLLRNLGDNLIGHHSQVSKFTYGGQSPPHQLAFDSCDVIMRHCW